MTLSNPKPVDDARTPHRRRLPRFDLSATQLIATALAAITATFLASYLGVSGTIIGAAVASVATAIGNAVYGQSLRSTRDRVRDVVPTLTRTDPASPTVVLPVAPSPSADMSGAEIDDSTVDAPPELPAGTGPAAGTGSAARTGPVLGRARAAASPERAWRRVAFAAAGVFATVLALVTSVEVLAGRPITDIVRGDSGSGTTLFGAGTAKQSTTTTTATTGATPTVTVTVTPSIVTVTPTVTQTAAPSTATVTPSASAPVSSGTTSGPSTTATSGTSTPSGSGTS